MSEPTSLAIRLERLERAVSMMAWWLVQAQTGFGQQDARGIDDILAGRRDAEDAEATE